jgi:PAS domain S-box-containing protein
MRAFAQSIVETVRHPLLVLDAGLRVVQANVAFYRTFRTTEPETEGRRLDELDGGHWDIPSLRTALENIIPRNESFEDFEVQGEFPGLGRKVMLLDARRVVRDEGGEPVVLLAIEDVTERVLAREELEKLNLQLEVRVRERTAQLEAANRELEAFCYSVSHDLRAPLRAINGYSDELLRTYPGRLLDEKGQHYLQRLRAGTQRMGQLIDDLLQLSKLSRGEMKWETVNLTAMAKVTAAELRRQEPGRNVTLLIEPGMTAEASQDRPGKPDRQRLEVHEQETAGNHRDRSDGEGGPGRVLRPR